MYMHVVVAGTVALSSSSKSIAYMYIWPCSHTHYKYMQIAKQSECEMLFVVWWVQVSYDLGWIAVGQRNKHPNNTIHTLARVYMFAQVCQG